MSEPWKMTEAQKDVLFENVVAVIEDAVRLGFVAPVPVEADGCKRVQESARLTGQRHGTALKNALVPLRERLRCAVGPDEVRYVERQITVLQEIIAYIAEPEAKCSCGIQADGSVKHKTMCAL